VHIDTSLETSELKPALDTFFTSSAASIRNLDEAWDPERGAPVFTIEGTYTTRGWTEWTQGFQFGCQILQFDATGDERILQRGWENTLQYMAPHVSHIGVHDHGFNNVSTYGNLLRLTREGRITGDAANVAFHELALKTSGAVQASRWSTIADGSGYIHSFNGPHSLFSDTIRSCRALVVAHRLGHVLMGENDTPHSLLGRAIAHMYNTSRYNVYYGEGRDLYDMRGRVVHESIFNMNDGQYRCPSTQQGYSPFSTWTRGLAWVMLGAAEQLEFMQTEPRESIDAEGGWQEIRNLLVQMATATCDFFIDNTATDGIPYWDTGAPGLAEMADWREKASQPDNPHEPVDSSAAAIGAQALLRLGRFLGTDTPAGKRYWQAGLTTARTLFSETYCSHDADHQGLLLHSVYHRPNNWDHIPADRAVPQGEACMWGDYHLMELAVYLQRVTQDAPYLTFFAGCGDNED
jgi:rhamnogalacturonyl hydrolase YesR